ncbi:MAG: NAD-dependent epimerase/dehydratase family protein [Lachnospiraceae bacterium]|nr:NAD-dependent epimerase/dehydratase family protein [Lachnospiraceae bacterium]
MSRLRHREYILRMERAMNKMLKNLQEFVSEIGKVYGERDAYKYIVNDSIVSKTYKELEHDVMAMASWLVDRGFSKKHIAIIGSSSYHWVVTFLGVACSGNVVIPIDKMLTEQEMLNLLVMGDVDMVFVSEEFEPFIREIEAADNQVKEIHSMAGRHYREILRTERRELPEIDPNAMAEILFTSGTTGVSKGVMLSQKNIVSNINEIYRMDYTQNLKCAPIVLSVLPIHHTFELTVDNLGVLYSGATVCINDKLENIVANLNKFKPSVILVVPTIAEIFYKKVMEGIASGPNKRKVAIAKRANKALSTVKIDVRRKLYKSLLEKFGGNLTNVVVGGAALRGEIVEAFDEFGVNMYQGYGLTECAPLVSANNPRANKAGSVGKPVSYMDVKIENGEIMVKGDGVMLGYYKNPEATAEAVTEDGWFHTGDLGYMDEEGYLFITGRCKNLIILDNGKNIYPEELEAHLMTIDGVKDVMVYESKGKICAVFQPTDVNDKGIIKGIKLGVRKINGTLPPYKKIVAIDFIAKDFPKTTTLKIKRKEAMQLIKDTIAKRTVEYVPAQTEEQQKIIKAFEKVLGRKEIGIKHDFFDMGGDSLSALEAAAIIGIQAQEIYENPTAEGLEKTLLAVKEMVATEDNYVDVNELIKHNSNIEYNNKVKYVLLTGATGFLGSHILRELLKRKLNVICLVRDEKKLKPVLDDYFPKESMYFRYKVMIGDIEKERFGLSDSDYLTLVNNVDMVIHTAANVSHAGHYEDLERTNVFGTQNVIDFCKDAGAVLQYTSTASVNGAGTVEQKNENVKFDEFNLDIGQNYSQNVYIHSKYKAEERVLIAREEGLKANIFRIGNLTWRMSDGKFQRNVQDNGFLDRCRGLLKLGVYSKELAEYPIDFTPVDECADAYVRLSLHNRVNNIYNLYNPNVFDIKRLGRKFIGGLKEVPKEIFEKSLKEFIQDKEVAVLSFYSSIASSSRNIPISNEFTVNELRKLDFKWSKIGIRYLSYMKKL